MFDPNQMLSDDDGAYIRLAESPGAYISLGCDHLPFAGQEAQAYAALRIGTGHSRSGKPCQDAYLYRAISHGVAAAVSDGISACSMGGTGAQLICEAAIDLIEATALDMPDEDAFIRALCLPEFHHRLREAWLRRLNDDWHRLSPDGGSAPLHLYGATLMFAVSTARWHMAFNIGDGQIFLFSEHETMPLRLWPKDGPAPRSMIYAGYAADVQCGVFPRSAFPGLMLTTDGLGDALARLPAGAAHDFLRQAARRFSKAGRVHLPFVYTGNILGETRTVDLSRQMGVTDDCCMVLLITPGSADDDAALCTEQIRRHFPDVDQIELLRRYGRRAGYLAGAMELCRLILISPADEPSALRDPRLTHFRGGPAQQWLPEKQWFSQGLRFAAYPLPADIPTIFLEEAHHAGAFRAGTPDSRRALHTFHCLRRLEAHLACQNLRLDDAANAWIALTEDDTGTLLIPQEALCERNSSYLPWSPDTRSVFCALAGEIRTANSAVPLFDPGAPSREFSAPEQRIADARFRVCRSADGSAWGLTNCGEVPWEFVSASGALTPVPPGKTMALNDGMSFSIPSPKGLVTCTVRLRTDR